MTDQGVYLTITTKSGEPFKNPWELFKTVHKITNSALTANSPDGGITYSIHTKTKQQADALLKMKKLNNGIEVNVQLNKQRNESRCVIRVPELRHMDIKDIIHELRDQSVIDARRVPGGEGDSTGGIIVLTIGKPHPPKMIRIGPMNTPVKPYYPLPRQCTKCLEFGHLIEKCRYPQERCTKCSGEHPMNNCKSTDRCRNCGGQHAPISRSCPLYAKEKVIIRTMINKNVSRKNAKKILDEMIPTMNRPQHQSMDPMEGTSKRKTVRRVTETVESVDISSDDETKSQSTNRKRKSTIPRSKTPAKSPKNSTTDTTNKPPRKLNTKKSAPIVLVTRTKSTPPKEKSEEETDDQVPPGQQPKDKDSEMEVVKNTPDQTPNKATTIADSSSDSE